MRWILPLVLLALLASPALADEILLNDGSAVEGKIQAVDHTGISVQTADKVVQIAPADLDVHYYYEEWAKRAGKDAESHLRLAVFAYENGLFNQARSQYRKAQRLDKDLVKKFEEEVIPRIKEGIAQSLLTLARQSIAKKDWDQAKRVIAKILTQLEDTEAADEARKALGSVHVWQLDEDEKRLMRTVAKYLPRDEEKALKAQAAIVKKLAPLDSRMQKAKNLVAKGLQTKSTNRQKSTFQTAAKRFEGIIKDLDKVAADAASDEALAAYVGEMRTTAVREAIDAYVHAGSVYLIRRDYQGALGMANKALALDPDNPHAKRFYEETLRGSQMRNGWYGRGR